LFCRRTIFFNGARPFQVCRFSVDCFVRRHSLAWLANLEIYSFLEEGGEMDEKRVALSLGVGFILFAISAMIHSLWWIAIFLVGLAIMIIGGWPFWKDMFTIVWHVITDKE